MRPDSPLDITWIRTSCVLIECAGARLLTDPWFARTMRGLPVFRAPGVALADVPRLDAIFASHLHPDHFDSGAVRRLEHSGLVLVGTRGTSREVRRRRLVVETRELAPWESTRVGPFSVTGTPASHTGPPPDEINALVEVGGWRVFFGGDSRWSDAFRLIRDRLGRPDVALLPIGGTRIFGRRTTMNPADAVRACNELRPRWAVPIHEGGEWLPVPPASWHPGRRRHFARLMGRSGLAVTPLSLEPGRTVRLWPGDS